jgi:glutamate carboxypeptidase
MLTGFGPSADFVRRATRHIAIRRNQMTQQNFGRGMAARRGLSGPALLAVLTCIFPTLAGAAPHPNARVLAAVKACEQSGRELLERAVAIDSGTGDVEGLSAVGALYTTELQALGAKVKSIAPAAPAVGNNIVATLTGTGKGRIVLIAHMDTVFNHGDVAKRMPHWEGQHYIGPGAGDDKSGGVTAVCAIKALKEIGFSDFARIDVLLNSNEETGSLGSSDLIRSLAMASELVINLERGIATDQILKARKGSATLTAQFTGRAAHSGLEPEKGRNAVIEAARFALALEKLSDSEKKTTVTVDILSGGDKTNVVPAHAELKADVRAFTNDELDRVEQAAAQLAETPSIDGVTIKTTLQRGFPPWPPNEHTDHVIERANRLYAEIGRKVTATEVGSSADVSFAAQTGTPSVDGFGIEGGGAHSVDDYADIATLVPRVYLLARLLMDVGHDPTGL